MNEEKQVTEPEVSEEYKAFLKAVKTNGAYVRIMIDNPDGTKKFENWNVKKGATDHNVTDDNMFGFRPLTRREQRKLFHTPFKYGRRVNA